ncbi:MAG: DUF1045 domain-containing protein [Betaproteobacteria bacterium]
MSRYAIYYAPDRDSALWRAGVCWLGRDPETREIVAPPAIDGLAPARQRQITESPRRYGWHGTLKAPFALSPGVAVDDLVAEMQRFCARREPFPLPPLAVGVVDGFIAVVPSRGSVILDDLAAACVECFDPFRAPMTATERSRRLGASLSERQLDYLERWGYPYVMDEYRFHMTLTGRLPALDQAALLPWLERHFAAALQRPVPVHDIALYEEPAPGDALRLLRRVGFSGG